MYCRGGNDTTKDEPNTNLAVNPLYQLDKADWWFQHDRGCDAAPPAAGEFLEIPANGEFTVELAHNRAQTTLSYGGKFVSDWPDGGQHPDDWSGWNTDGTPAVCLKEDGALHTYNESSAGGTAFAISYHSDIKDVTIENLVVFTTLDHTPWKRLATYRVPNLQECPEGGCHCAWLWIPNGCGQPNMYMQGFKCNVTAASPTAAPLATAQIPVYCADDDTKCVKGAKQMLAWNQKTGNNIETEDWVTPNYNMKCGWKNGAQTDIFAKVEGQNATTATATPSAVVSTASKADVSIPMSSSTSVPLFSPASLTLVAETPSTLATRVSTVKVVETAEVTTVAAPTSSPKANSGTASPLVPTPSCTQGQAQVQSVTRTRTRTRHHRPRPSATA
ncbi:uncharacterized protein BDR25DRAFT_279546 [Lindgomyces ingoldianus]|uniref:Uncharacterized protein n=1 Tax=Lindgomyces ingoldianus TaxID=673940 RepID=A0ACB6R869_9PLEO|nr:uncharacterized protein BDR25DRAFT_279546 [Lindgomyces ingoldianus]KAF2475468.1 hypothetical protein BDR25DRAFT_279546 [Lindgomyces ingoldianus]